MNRTVMLRLFATITPILCLGLGAWLIWGQYQKSVALETDLARVSKNVEFQKTMIAEIGSQPLAEKEPAAPISDAEQAAFLEDLRQIARNTGVVLTKWANVPTAPPTEANKVVLPAWITPMLSNLEVSGPYPAIRNFLYEIARAPRLLNFSGVKWTRNDEKNTTSLSVTITRYVTPPQPADALPASGVASLPKDSL